jgi:hypothetical protein
MITAAAAALQLLETIATHNQQLLEARGTKERARLGWPFFGLNFFILKTMMFRT